MVIEAVHFRQLVEVIVKRRAHAFHDLRVGQVAALIRDAQRGQAEAGGGDAGHARRIARAVEIVAGAIENLAGLWARLLPEEQACLTL